MLLNCGVGEDSWESLGLQGDPTSPFWRRSVLGVHWKDWFWSWNSNTLATWCEELTHLKRPWCWERLRAGGEGDDRGWDGWMASLIQWTWVWVDPGGWWWTGKPGVLRFMGSQRVSHNWATELNWKVFYRQKAGEGHVGKDHRIRLCFNHTIYIYEERNSNNKGKTGTNDKSYNFKQIPSLSQHQNICKQVVWYTEEVISWFSLTSYNVACSNYSFHKKKFL